MRILYTLDILYTLYIIRIVKYSYLTLYFIYYTILYYTPYTSYIHRPTTFSGLRALNFVLENQNLIDKTLLINIRLIRVDEGYSGRKGSGKGGGGMSD